MLLISSWPTCGDVQHTVHQKFLYDYKMKEFKDNNNLRVVSVNMQQSLNFLDSCRACKPPFKVRGLILEKENRFFTAHD